MKEVNVNQAREELYRLLDETARNHEPLLIRGPHSNAVLIAEEAWNSVQETLCLLSVPGLAQSIRACFGAAREECQTEPGS
jgi:antitoxin YefM